MKKLYYAQSVIIGRIEGTTNDYFIDIIEANGNQQTVATGTLDYVKSCISKIIFKY